MGKRKLASANFSQAVPDLINRKWRKSGVGWSRRSQRSLAVLFAPD